MSEDYVSEYIQKHLLNNLKAWRELNQRDMMQRVSEQSAQTQKAQDVNEPSDGLHG